MKWIIRFAVLAALVASSTPGLAQSTQSSKQLDPQGYYPRLQGPCTTQADGKTCKAVTAADPLPVTVVSGGGGGGGGSGDASAANQATQITAANLTNTRLGDITTPAAGSVNARLEAMRALLAGTLTVDTVIRAAPVNRGATVGTTAVTLAAANPSRRGFAIQVQSTTASCYVSTIATATADFNALLVAPGAYYETPPTHTGAGAISVICTAAGTAVYAREW